MGYDDMNNKDAVAVVEEGASVDEDGSADENVPVGEDGSADEDVSTVASGTDELIKDCLTQIPMLEVLRAKLSLKQFAKVEKIKNPELWKFLAETIELCGPDRVFVCDDSPEDLAAIRAKALESGEEKPLSRTGHVYHFDPEWDQGRATSDTKVLVPEGVDFGKEISTKNVDEANKEMDELMRGAMEGREMLVLVSCLGPVGSKFSIVGVQITDSPYVVDNERLLYRRGYEEMVKQSEEGDMRFFKFVHSSGSLDKSGRRIYMDPFNGITRSVNTQYGGNTIGLKKLAMRLAMRAGLEDGKRVESERWLTEHMLVMGVKGLESEGHGDRRTYMLGAFPSMCGKTSTAMIPNAVVVGDDIAYLRNCGGEARAVNVEAGVFGILEGVNPDDDPQLIRAMEESGDVIYSNVLVHDWLKGKEPFWIGKSPAVPESGENFAGCWEKGCVDANGKPVPASHPNSRVTLSLRDFENVDLDALENPEGVGVSAVVYGGRDPDTSVPVREALDLDHGLMLMGMCLESETTAATVEGAKQKRIVFNPASNIDFLSMPVAEYVDHNRKFFAGLSKPPRIFGVNYFLQRSDGKFLNDKNDKWVWYQWMEKRVNGEVDVVETSVGGIPKYEDLVSLFKELLGKDYTREEYEEQFAIRKDKFLEKIGRARAVYQNESRVGAGVPSVVFEQLDRQEALLLR